MVNDDSENPPDQMLVIYRDRHIDSISVYANVRTYVRVSMVCLTLIGIDKLAGLHLIALGKSVCLPLSLYLETEQNGKQKNSSRSSVFGI